MSESITCQRRRQLRDPDSPFRLVRLMGELAAALERVCPWEDIHFIFSRMVDDKEFVAHFLGDAMERFKRESWLDDLVEEEKKHYTKCKLFGKQEVEKMTQEGVFWKFRRVLQEFGFFRVWQWELIGLEPHILAPRTMDNKVFAPEALNTVESSRIGMPTEEFAMRAISKETFLSLSSEKNGLGTVVLIDTRALPNRSQAETEFKDDERYLGPILKELRKSEIEKSHYPIRESVLMSRFIINYEEWMNFIRKRMLELPVFSSVKDIRYERLVEVFVIRELYPHMPRRYDQSNDGSAVWCEEAMFNQETNAYHNIAYGTLDKHMVLHKCFFFTTPELDVDEDKKIIFKHYGRKRIGIRPIIVLG